MKYLIFSILIFTSFGSGALTAQDYLELIKTQEYDQVSKYLSQDINLKINRNKRVKGRKSSIAAIRKFLADFNPVRVESSHKGAKVRGDSNYIVGKLYNDKNEGIRVFINLENGQNGKVICDLKFKSL